MDCTEFRRHHLAYVDDTLPGDVLVAAERHRSECDCCAAHDTSIRRSLLLARNLPALEVSADFAARLEARLRDVRAEGAMPPAPDEARWYGAPELDARWYERLVARGWGRQAAAAAVVLAAASAGYTVRGGRAVTTPTTTAATAPAAAAFGTAAMGGAGLAFGTLGVAEVAAAPAGLAMRAARSVTGGAASSTGHDGRRTTARPDGVAGATRGDDDDLGMPMYIPLPAGALENAALLGSASVGVPVWPAALLAGEAPGQLRSAAPGAPTVRLVGLSH